MAFGLGFVGHARQVAQARRYFVALQRGGSIGTGITLGHRANLDTGALRHFTRLAHNRLQLVDKAVHCRGHVADFISAVERHALGQVTFAGRQVIESGNQQAQLAQYPAA
ncbi:hypothetical protein D3C80_1003640 [compost metagenome]